MTTTFSTVELKEAGKFEGSFETLTKATVLHGGKRNVQSSANYGVDITVHCRGKWSDVTALADLIGAPYTLTTEETSFTNCYITDKVDFKESDGRDISDGSVLYDYTVRFVRKTV